MRPGLSGAKESLQIPVLIVNSFRGPPWLLQAGFEIDDRSSTGLRGKTTSLPAQHRKQHAGIEFQGVLLVRFLLIGVKIRGNRAKNCASLSQEMERD
ncbi:MAG: hypothetical protein A4E20_16455 [Nitrospira sp. SG-bin2]|nr:MAG: hypothetical protein A4E20_16455 [Nitrospira sp. SG-bin2]